MTRPEARRSVEDLAQALYEASDPSGIPWVRRGRVVREPWLHTAQEQIARSEDDLERKAAMPNAVAGPDAQMEPNAEIGASAEIEPSSGYDRNKEG